MATKSVHNGDKYPARYALFLMAYYVANAAYQGFISLFFQDNGMDPGRVGAIMAAGPLVSLFTQPLWGMVGDKSKNRTNVLRLILAVAAASALAFYGGNTFVFYLLIMALISGAYTAIQPMGDSILLEALGNEKKPFGPIRLAGGVAFGIASFFAGRLFAGRMDFVPATVSVLLLLAFAATFAMPNVKGHDTKREKAKVSELFKQREIVLLLSLLALLQMSMGFFYAFFSMHFRGLPGGTSELLGICFLISAFSEIPFLLFADKLIDRFGAGRLMCISATVMTIRWVILGLVQNVPVVMASQVLHGWGFIVMTVSTAKYMNEHVPEALKARAQMLLAIIGFGIARTLGTLGGGFLVNTVGYQWGFLINAGLTLLTLLIFAPHFLRKKPSAL